ncbi:MAG TPA: RuBisCO accumulation factor 1, partial [Leptolyngbya sp.]|nr:RuBisCO accumulation factor 1 [Leptolyngbya sp.]
LTDFEVTPKRPAPRLPLYRLESDEHLPRILPVAGKLPLTIADLKAVPMVEETGAFALVQFSGTGAWITVPGWQVIRSAEDPIAILCDSDRLPTPLPGATEEIMLVLDRSQRDWDADSYFAVAENEQLALQWFEEAPTVSLLGRVILVMRPKKVLDEDYAAELWQLDE